MLPDMPSLGAAAGNAERMRDLFGVTADALTIRGDLCRPTRRTDAL
jgi:hypothetical protein